MGRDGDLLLVLLLATFGANWQLASAETETFTVLDITGLVLSLARVAGSGGLLGYGLLG